MTNERRTLMLMVMDGHPSVPALLYHLDRFRRCDDMLRWLIRNQLTGAKFLEWVRHEHGGSILKAGAFVLQRLARDHSMPRIIGGRDYLLS